MAAASLAAKEYRNGVAPAGGRVTAPEEVSEAKQFLDQARFDAPFLPAPVRAVTDSDLARLSRLLDRAPSPDSVDRRSATIVQRIGAALPGALDPFPAAPPSLARGRAVFEEQCVKCHGETGKGNGPKAKTLKGPPPADLTDAAAMATVSPIDVYRKLTIGVAGTAMPEFEDQLTPADRWAVTAYVATLRAAGPAVLEGEGLYAVQCASCHGARGAGDGPLAATLSVRPPALSDLAVQGRFSDRELAALSLHGRSGTPMPGLAPGLDSTGAAKIVSFVRTLPTAERQAGAGGNPGAAVFTAVRRQLDSAVALRSDRVAFDAYLTFEQVESDVRARNAALASELEDGFAALRQRAAAGASPADLAVTERRVLSGLERAERLVSDKESGANLFIDAFIILIREGFEAMLIVAALMAFLAKAGATERRRDVAWGAWAAVAASVITAVLVELLFHVTPGQREALEGVTMLLATAVLFYVSYWLLSKLEADKWSAFVKGRMQAALSGGSALALASVAFLAVYREGFETILFYQALVTSGGPGEIAAVAGGIAAGAAGLVVLYVAINRFGVRIPLRAFFGVTSATLYYMAFVFAGKGVAELQEGGVVGTSVLRWGPRVPFLGIYPTVQSLALQGLLLALALVALGWAMRPARHAAAG